MSGWIEFRIDNTLFWVERTAVLERAYDQLNTNFDDVRRSMQRFSETVLSTEHRIRCSTLCSGSTCCGTDQEKC